MEREIFYTFNAAAWPADPTVNSTKYTAGGIAYPVGGGYFKSIAKEGDDFSAVTSKSFERAPEDYVHYYPLTTDFNDHKGSNNLINQGCTITGNGCLISSNPELMNFTTILSYQDISVYLKYTPSGSNTWRNLLGDNGSQCALFCSGNTLGYYNSGFTSTGFTLVNGVEYALVVVKSGTICRIYVNKDKKLDVTNCFENNIYPIRNMGGNSYNQSAIGLIKEVKVFNRALSQDEINSL